MRGEYYGEGGGAGKGAPAALLSSSRPTDRRHGGSRTGRGRRRYGWRTRCAASLAPTAQSVGMGVSVEHAPHISRSGSSGDAVGAASGRDRVGARKGARRRRSTRALLPRSRPSGCSRRRGAKAPPPRAAPHDACADRAQGAARPAPWAVLLAHTARGRRRVAWGGVDKPLGQSDGERDGVRFFKWSRGMASSSCSRARRGRGR